MLNRAIMMGRLTHDPELKTTQAGPQFCRFSIACDRDFKNTSGEKETDFFDCVAWRKTAEFVSRYFAKGRMIIVEGRMQNRSWTDKEGNKRRSTEIIVDAAHFGDSKPKGEEGEPPEPPAGGGDGFGFPGGFNPDLILGLTVTTANCPSSMLTIGNSLRRGSSRPPPQRSTILSEENSFYGEVSYLQRRCNLWLCAMPALCRKTGTLYPAAGTILFY